MRLISAGSLVRASQAHHSGDIANNNRFEFGQKKKFPKPDFSCGLNPGWFFDIYIQGSKIQL